MASADPTAVIILGEIVVLETIAIIGFVIFFFVRKKKIKAQLGKSKSDYLKSVSDRKSSLKSSFEGTPYAQINNIDQVVDNLVEHETAFFHSILGIIEKNDGTAIGKIDDNIHALVNQYTLLIKSGDALGAETEEENPIVPDIDSAIDDLLADEADDAEGDPAFDLSEAIVADDEIAEIPDELLADDNQDESATASEITSDDPSDPEQSKSPTDKTH
ncbi:MAG: hypothetical protein RRB22_07210 [Gammaproteobacteria bacterium]|nr:hypothetical protein [Gammaproteobacteria bacterium]